MDTPQHFLADLDAFEAWAATRLAENRTDDPEMQALLHALERRFCALSRNYLTREQAIWNERFLAGCRERKLAESQVVPRAQKPKPKRRTLFMRAFAAIVFLALAVGFATPARATTYEVDLSAANLSCNTTLACSMQVYRAPGACPASGIGALSYTQLASTVAPATSTATQQTFTYADTSTAVANSSPGDKFCYYVTNAYAAGTGGPSAPSATFQASIPGPTTPPLAPSLTGSVAIK